MTKEVIIKYDENNTSKKGRFFESLTNSIFKSQRFIVQGNVNYTGMEFDLLCQHIDRTNETVLVECKAKDKLSSDEITKFAFNVGFKKLSYGYFLYTKDFSHQVQGLINELKQDKDDRYNNLYFWNAEKIIELLEASDCISKFEIKFHKYNLTKLILFYSYFGIYYIILFSDTTQPKYFSVFDAKTLNEIIESETIELLKKEIIDIEQLSLKKFSVDIDNTASIIAKVSEYEIETVVEIQESEFWDDYKPASSKYFVGREDYKNKIFSFLDDVRNKKINQRVFYIDGKSGWGKSSLLTDLRGRFRNKHYKNQYFSYVVDSRSANSQNFIALAFTNMLKKASKNNFIPKEFSEIVITSFFDILKSEQIDKLLNYLEENNKLLILIFDQFEDTFRKPNIFKSFYKLLIDTNERISNIVLGFSWKSETFLPADEKEISNLLTQSKELSYSITLSEFNISESKKIIKQLETQIDYKLDDEFIRKIIDNSQGFPWLVKKLCIHIYKQYNNGISIDDINQQDFNVQQLFDDDLEGLNPEEVKALKYIANRSYDNNTFDVVEVDEIIKKEIITSLTDKRLIIKSGTKYNIYWDIFRDYLVTETVPKVGETYLLRATINSVYEIFTVFKNKHELTLSEIVNLAPNNVSERSADNLLRELRSIGLIVYKNEKYILKDKDFIISEDNFRKYVRNKLKNHSFYLELIKIKDKEIELSDLAKIITKKIKTGRNYKPKTLLDYAQNFINWLNYVKLPIVNLNPSLIQKAKNENTFTPQEKPINVINFFKKLQDGDTFTKKQNKLLYDLKALGLITYEKYKIKLTIDGEEAKQNDSKLNKILCINALKSEKIKIAYEQFLKHPNIKAKDFKELIPELLVGIKHITYAQSTSRKLYEWVNYIYNNCGKKT